METKVLEDIGLSKNEINVFIKLLELGETKSGDIIKKSCLQNSAVYNAINSLIEKGLISYIKKSSVKYYKAADPGTILNYIDSKKTEYLNILPELRLRQSKKEDSGVEYYSTYKGIKTLLFEVKKDAKKGDIMRFFSISNPEEYKKATENVLKIEKTSRKEQGIISKGIFHENVRDLAKKSKVTQKRFVNFPMPPNTQIMNNKVAIISWKNEVPSGILIKSKDFYDSYVEFFEHIWKIGKK